MSLAVMSSFFCKGQFLELGGGLGTLNYTGDLNRSYDLSSSNVGITGYSRFNLSKIVSLRLSALGGKLSDDDSMPIDALGQARDTSFNRSIIEVSLMMEYYFLDYFDEKSQLSFSPYFFGGFGFLRLFNVQRVADEYSRLQGVVPFGIGFKKLIGRKFSLNLELGARKTFFDHLDNISDTQDITSQNLDFGNPNDDDWYYFFGISFTYIFYKIPCPFPYIPNRYILDR